MFCKACGRNNPDGLTTCYSCGAPLGSEPAEQPAAAMNTGTPAPPPVSAPNAYNPAPTRAPSATTTAERKNYIALIGALAALVGVFLPFWIMNYSVSLPNYLSTLADSKTYSMISDSVRNGIIVIVFAIGGICTALKITDVKFGSIGAGILTALFTVIELDARNDLISTASAKCPEYKDIIKEQITAGSKIGIGCYVLFIGAGLMILGGIIEKATAKK
ncbi:MAG: zinc ribbon domain-containing protein [Oscillospiraceae bacterium]|nr:zinc ribbon domain-containing protein [Oscillospiraceae bacterium]